MKIIQIVPDNGGGLLDYATVLNAKLVQQGVEGSVIAINKENAGSIEAQAIVLHYVNYGYSRRGCPWWLVKFIKHLRHTQKKIVIVFHEVYASGRFWQSSFWLNPIQRTIAREVYNCSDGCVTSMNLYRSLLTEIAKSSVSPSIHTMPVFSTVGEVADFPSWKFRKDQIVVFGGIGARVRAYKQTADELVATCSTLRVDTIFDVGPDLGFVPRIHGLEIISCGKLASWEVQELMLGSKYGFLNYPAAFLAKSTIFASYCAHGLTPLIPRKDLRNADGLIQGEHFCGVSSTVLAPAKDSMESIAKNAHSWYQTHSLEAHSNLYLRLFGVNIRHDSN